MTKIKILVFLLFFMVQVVCVYGQVINKVVAVVNDEIITQQDVDRLLSVLYAQYVDI